MKNIPISEIKMLYESGKSLSEISKIFNCNATTILNKMRQHGLERRTVSKSLQGREITWNDKIGISQKGKVLSKEHKIKISNTRKERKIKPWNIGLSKKNDNLTYGMSGSCHWNWKGGISSESTRLRQSSEYKVWRKEVFKRDNYTCQHCEKRGGSLEAHHLIAMSLLLKFDNLRCLIFDVVNGETLCVKCHKDLHREKVEPFQQIGEEDYDY